MPPAPKRTAAVTRETRETRIYLALNLDEFEEPELSTGIGFFDHMLTHIAKHGNFGLKVKAEGDLEVDPHHTVEDVGIALGQAFVKAIGSAEGIRRFGHATLPMDEALAEVAVDISGRPYLVFRAAIPKVKLGDFDAELAEEFFRAFAMNARVTLHMILPYGSNAHHCVEILYKAFARALSDAVSMDPRVRGIPSTKGTLNA